MILGLDISTSITGATIIQDGKIVDSFYWDTRNKNKFSSLYDKAHHIRIKLLLLKTKYNITKVFIEQSLHTFRSGFSSAQTLSTLSMASPFSILEKQVLLETKNLKERRIKFEEILSTYTTDFSNLKTIQ